MATSNPNTISYGSLAYGVSNGNTYGGLTTSGNGISAANVPASRLVQITIPDIDPVVVFEGEENNIAVSLELSPERDITPFEQMQITTMMMAISIGAYPSRAGIMKFVRKHNLERHFNMSAV